MTREEAIKAFEEIKASAQSNLGAKHAVGCDGYYRDRIELAEAALNALRPVSREQVEKVFPGCRSCKSCRSCVFCINDLKGMPCKKCDPNAECAVTEYKPSNFCPVCGKPLTDEAVQMVMERMEALYGE